MSHVQSLGWQSTTGILHSHTAHSRTVPNPRYLPSRLRHRLQQTRAQPIADAASPASQVVQVPDQPSKPSFHGTLRTQTEQLLQNLEAMGEEIVDEEGGISGLTDLKNEAENLSKQIDLLYNACFSGLNVKMTSEEEGGECVEHTFQTMDEPTFAEMGRAEPEVMRALLTAAEKRDPVGWQRFQSQVRPLKLARTRIETEIRELSDALGEAIRQQARRGESAARFARSGMGAPTSGTLETATVRIVLISGFESFNVDLYRKAAQQIKVVAPHVSLQVFSDRELTGPGRARVEAALEGADVFFGSLLFDYDQVEWLHKRIAAIPVRLIFESALELMSSTQIGTFTMAPGDGPKGPPPIVKKVLSLFGSKREEDKMVGYLSFLKIGPQLLKFVPGKKAQDLRNWLTIYSYWNQGGLANVVSMFLYLTSTFFPDAVPTGAAPAPIAPPVETPAVGCLHPAYQDGRAYFTSPSAYMKWYQKHGPLRGTDAPRVAILLYRKHVITEQPYVLQLISQMEREGVLPVPVFINGVEGHTIVRDLLTSTDEQNALAQGRIGGISTTLSTDAVRVDAVVSTIGFPLVGGPAGSMEGGRQADVAKGILGGKNIPYIIAAPLLIQDMASWLRDGVTGLQAVVLYSLPELDGAIDTVPLGALVGDNIYIVPERVRKLAGRVKAWVNLRRKPPAERRVAVLVYGFPPGVGATGTAALLNVPRSLDSLMHAMHAEGYNLGSKWNGSALDCEAVITTLAAQDQQTAVYRGAAGVKSLGSPGTEAAGITASAAEVSPAQLKEWLSYPREWGPTEWGPMPFLPDNDVLVKRLEGQWGQLRSYRGIMTSTSGQLVVPGLQAGNVFMGVQPLLGLEGDPMRLLFERDLTPHPQYAAFYKWLQHDFKADAVVHMGMHGTVEWLPGSPLGNTGLSWSDVLLGDMPNVYIYACNNPSESVIAKRRGYGTIISYNVPPYGRAGLYKQLATLKELISEYRDEVVSGQTAKAASSQAAAAAFASGQSGAEALPTGAGTSPQDSSSSSHSGTGQNSDPGGAGQAEGRAGGKGPSSLREAIFLNLQLAGIQEDVPFKPAPNSPLWAMAAASEAAAAAAAPPPFTSKESTPPKSQQAGKADGLATVLGSAPPKVSKTMPQGALRLTEELVMAMSDEEWALYAADLYSYLQVLEQRLYSEGLHVLGAPPSRDGLVQYLGAYFDERLPHQAVEVVADLREEEGVQVARARLERIWQQQVRDQAQAQQEQKEDGEPVALAHRPGPELDPLLQEALEIKNLLTRNTEELTNVLRALGGEWIAPEPGGDLLRDGAGVLPTGRNIHALDPYRMPSPAAMDRGAEAAEAVLQAHRALNAGAYPETVSINLWGLDAIKTKGESVAMVCAMVGAVPVREGTGRIARFELLPLEALGGRPRVDVLCNMSGIFRDSFQNVVELLDDLFERVAAADEPLELNAIRRHAQAMEAKGLARPAARLFSNPAGDYGSMVNERVGQGSWENGDELGDTWAARNSFSYGRGGERGAARPEVLRELLSTTDRIIQEVDSVEYGLTDIQEYYANTGALKRAAEVAQGGKAVGCSIVEAFGKDSKPRELDQVLRLEYRSKLLNPKWAEAMASQGSGGAYEISQRMTAMVGWGATAGFSEDWAWDQAASTYTLDPAMSEKLRKANPQAFSNMLKRMLEAAGRGMWTPSEQVLSKLKSMYGEMDDLLEGVGKPPPKPRSRS